MTDRKVHMYFIHNIVNVTKSMFRWNIVPCTRSMEQILASASVNRNKNTNKISIELVNDACAQETERESNIILIIDMIRLNRYKWAKTSIATAHAPTDVFIVVVVVVDIAFYLFHLLNQ